MLTETIAGLGAVKTAFDMAKGLKDIHDATLRDRAVIDLQKEILSAQQAQFALIERVGTLEKQVAEFEKWDAEKERYELKEIFPGSFARAVKQDARGAEPPHLICAKCYEERKKRILQQASSVHLDCPECKSRIKFRDQQPSAVSTSFNRGGGGPNSWMGS